MVLCGSSPGISLSEGLCRASPAREPLFGTSAIALCSTCILDGEANGLFPGSDDNIPDSVITHPAAQVLSQFEVSVFHGDTPASAGQLPHPPLKLGKCLIRPADFGALEDEAEKADLVGRGHLALFLVDRELELLPEETANVCHYPLTRPTTFHQNDKVIGITGKPVPSTLQFLIQIIQEDVSQKW